MNQHVTPYIGKIVGSGDLLSIDERIARYQRMAASCRQLLSEHDTGMRSLTTPEYQRQFADALEYILDAQDLENAKREFFAHEATPLGNRVLQ